MIRSFSSILVLHLAFVFWHFATINSFANNASPSSDHILTAKQARSDFKQIYDRLGKNHPNLYAHQKVSEFKAIYQSILEELDSDITVRQFYSKATKLIGAVCDEHTYLQPPTSYQLFSEHEWPWHEKPLVFYDGKLFLEDGTRFGRQQIEKINHRTGEEIAGFLKERISADGCPGEAPQFVNTRPLTNFYLLSSFVKKDGRFSVQYSQNKNKRIWVNKQDRYPQYAAYRSSLMDREFANSVALQSLDFKQVEKFKSRAQANLKYYQSERHEGIAYVRIEEFVDNNERDKKLEKVFRDVIKTNPATLILDLSQNAGGWSAQTQLAIALLMPRAHRLWDEIYARNTSTKRPSNFKGLARTDMNKRHKVLRTLRKFPRKGRNRVAEMPRRSFGFPDYKGKIYVLVGPKTASAASIMARYLQLNRKAKIVGAIDAANRLTSCEAAIGYYSLNHSKLQLHIPDICFRIKAKEARKNSNFKIDIAVNSKIYNSAQIQSAAIRVAVGDIEKSRPPN